MKLGYNAAALGGTRPANRKVVLDELSRVESVVREANIKVD